MKHLRLTLLLLSFSIITVHCGSYQNGSESQTAKEVAVKKLLESRRYRFVPQTMQTQAGRSIQVHNHFLDLRNDTVVAALPYFGVARSPQIGGTRGPLDFTSTDFSYTSEIRRKRNTEINIRLNDRFLDAEELYLSVSTTGYANLRARFNDRQSVSFFGDIRTLPTKR